MSLILVDQSFLFSTQHNVYREIRGEEIGLHNIFRSMPNPTQGLDEERTAAITGSVQQMGLSFSNNEKLMKVRCEHNTTLRRFRRVWKAFRLVTVVPHRVGAVPGSAGVSIPFFFSSEWYVTYFDLALLA